MPLLPFTSRKAQVAVPCGRRYFAPFISEPLGRRTFASRSPTHNADSHSGNQTSSIMAHPQEDIGATNPSTKRVIGPLVWTSECHSILVNGLKVAIKGINWFGFETTDGCVHGLWDGLSKSLSDYLDLLHTHGFNALRLPFSVKLALALDSTYPNSSFVAADSSLAGLSCGQIMDLLIVECGKRGILVMLDQHRLDPERGISDLWYDEGYEEPVILKSWDVMVGRYKKYWNVFALDLKNEPHGSCTWGSGEALTDWKAASERVMKFIAHAHPDFLGLFFVSGIWGGGGHWWGGNFRGVRMKPVDLGEEGMNRRVVYTPHVYGPDVYPQAYFSSWSFPNNLPAIWEAHWGFLRGMEGRGGGEGGRAVVVSEWGGFCKGKDAKWQEKVARYLWERGMADNFYWCLNPNSGDTGGILLDDWTTLHIEKLRILHTLQPAPTLLRELDVLPSSLPEKENKKGEKGREEEKEGKVVRLYEYQLGVETAALSSTVAAVSAKKVKRCFGLF